MTETESTIQDETKQISQQVITETAESFNGYIEFAGIAAGLLLATEIIAVFITGSILALLIHAGISIFILAAAIKLTNAINTGTVASLYQAFSNLGISFKILTVEFVFSLIIISAGFYVQNSYSVPGY